MPRNFCSNPYGVHKRQVQTTLRPVTRRIIEAGLLSEGDLVCNNCRTRLLLETKPKEEPIEDSASTPTPVAPTPAAPSQDNEFENSQSEAVQCNSQCSVDEMQVLTDEESSNESAPSSQAVSTEDEEPLYAKTAQADTARSALNHALPELGESPIKTRGLSDGQKVLKIRNKMRVVRESLEASYGTQLPDEPEPGTAERLTAHYFVKHLVSLIVMNI